MSGSKRSPVLLGLSAAGLGVAATLLMLEIVLRFLPVCTLLPSQPVNAENPVLRYAPNQKGVWSQGAGMSQVVPYRVNNYGFVNDQDYRTDDPRPLVAVVGDSFVEALMVPPQGTFHALLAKRLAGRARVYSFSRSGAPLSQYLAYAAWAGQAFHPNRLIINVVGNDFDESFLEYKDAAGLHFFKQDDSGAYGLLRRDYTPGPLAFLVQRSRLGMYLLLNLRAHQLPQNIRWLLHPPKLDAYSGNTLFEADPRRMQLGRTAIRRFLDLLPTLSGLTPSRILLLIDGNRQSIYAADDATPPSYADMMLQELAQRARANGYGVVELRPWFVEDYARHGEKFEVPGDGHWNQAGHRVATEAVLASGFLGNLSADTQPVDRQGTD